MSNDINDNPLLKRFNLLVRLCISRFNVVSKEEFDAHSEVLARASAKIAQLDERLTELEKSPASDSKHSR